MKDEDKKIIVISEMTAKNFESKLNEAVDWGYIPAGPAFYGGEFEPLVMVMMKLPQQPAVQMFRGPIPQA